MTLTIPAWAFWLLAGLLWLNACLGTWVLILRKRELRQRHYHDHLMGHWIKEPDDE